METSLAPWITGLVTIPTALIVWYKPAFQTAFWGQLPHVIWPNPDLLRKQENMYYPSLNLIHQRIDQDMKFIHFICPEHCISEAPAFLSTSFRVLFSIWNKPIRVKLQSFSMCSLRKWFAFNTHLGWVKVFPETKMAQLYLTAKCSILFLFLVYYRQQKCRGQLDWRDTWLAQQESNLLDRFQGVIPFHEWLPNYSLRDGSSTEVRWAASKRKNQLPTQASNRAVLLNLF